MSLPTGFATPAQAVAPQPLHVVARDSFAPWSAAQPPAVQAWLAVHRFDGFPPLEQFPALLEAYRAWQPPA